uniref:Uncharacterized protein n=1 Tax=Vitrella brassicaformis TaxID=1169539 RepID=A0A7S1KFH3_9ALVE
MQKMMQKAVKSLRQRPVKPSGSDGDASTVASPSDDANAIPLDPQEILDMARQQTGLEQLVGSEEDVLAAADVLLKSALPEGKDMSFLGRFLLSQRVRQAFCNLLYMADRAHSHPAILRQQIEQPIFVVGFDRVSVSLVQQLLACDEANRAPTFSEMLYPFGEQGEYVQGASPQEDSQTRLAAAQEAMDLMFSTNDYLTRLGALTADTPFDDSMIVENSLRSASLATHFDAPVYQSWLSSNHPSYTFHKTFLQHLQWQRAGDRWVLKMPAHMLALDALFETYPDARVIFLHRDPKVALGPVCKIVSSVREKLMDDADVTVTSHQQAELMAEMVNTAAAFRRDHPALKGRFVDVTHDALLRDPVGTLKKVYRQCGLSMSRRASHSMWEFINQHRDKRDQLFRQHEPLDQFGLDEDDLDEAFQPYYSETRQIQTQRRFSRLMPTCGGGNTIARRTSSQSGRWRRLSLPQSLSVMATRRSESYTVSIRRSESQRQDSK